MTKTEKDLYDFILKQSICGKKEIYDFFSRKEWVWVDLINLINSGYIQIRKTNLGKRYMKGYLENMKW